MMRRRLAVVCCAAALVPLAGCGGDKNSAADGGPAETGAEATTGVPDSSADMAAIDPCLLSDEEMAGILSQQLPSDEGAITVTSQPSSGVGDPTCTYSWIRSSWSAGSGKEFQVAVLRPDDLQFTAGFGERTPIDGVGDEAFEMNENYFARVGAQVVQVVNLQETREASVAVLTAAAGHL
jgi:hypothetical protein